MVLNFLASDSVRPMGTKSLPVGLKTGLVVGLQANISGGGVARTCRTFGVQAGSTRHAAITRQTGFATIDSTPGLF